MVKGTAPQRWGCVAVLMALLGATGPTAMSQQFAKLQADCLTLDCAVARKSYSFDAMPDSQESSTTATTPPKPATKSDSVREGAWRKLPSNFVHDQKDLWLFPVRVAQGHYWLPTALFTGATAALIATDPQTMPYFRQTDFFQDSDHAPGCKVSGVVVDRKSVV